MNVIVKYLTGEVFRHLITAICVLLVTNHYLGADIAAKINAGDTVTLWNGYNLSMRTMVEYLSTAAPAIMIPVLLGVWMRIKARFKTIKALGSSSMGELKAEVAEASPIEKIQVVAASPSAI